MADNPDCRERPSPVVRQRSLAFIAGNSLLLHSSQVAGPDTSLATADRALRSALGTSTITARYRTAAEYAAARRHTHTGWACASNLIETNPTLILVGLDIGDSPLL